METAIKIGLRAKSPLSSLYGEQLHLITPLNYEYAINYD